MAPAPSTSDAQLIALLRSGTIDENTALKTIYKDHWPTVAAYVLRNSGDRDSARDVFQDGMIVLYRNIKQQKFNGESAIGTYLFSICRFLWLKDLKKRGREADDPGVDRATFHTPLHGLLETEQRRALLALFDRLGEACKQMLLLCFYEDLDMREIARRTGFKDEQNARNKKYKCLKGLKELIQQRGELARSLREPHEHDAT